MKIGFSFACFVVAFLIGSQYSMGQDLLPPNLDFEGLRFRDAAFDNVSIVILDGDIDGRYTGYKIPFLKKGYKIEDDHNLPLGGGDPIYRKPVINPVKYLIKEEKVKGGSRFFRRVKKIETLNDLKGFVRIRTAHEALEYLRLTTSMITHSKFRHAMEEIYCVSNFVETAPEFQHKPVAPMAECKQYGFEAPTGPFDLEIAKVEVEIEGSISMTGQELIKRLSDSLKRTTTEKKVIEIELEKPEGTVKVKRKGQILTPEEETMLASLVQIVKDGKLRVTIEIEAELDEDKIPEFFVITRTVVSGFDSAFARVTEEVGRDGSWRVLKKEILTPLNSETFDKFLDRAPPK